MRQIIIDRIKAITEYKEKNNIIPKEATLTELQRALQKLLKSELESLKAEGIIERVGETVNGDEIMKLR